MNRGEFEKRLYISYLDEATVYSFKDVIYHAVVSMIVSKEKYIQNIEKGWADLRHKFGVKDGICLHFTDIKALLNPKYLERPQKERNLDMEDIFCDSSNVLFDKLYAFYVAVNKFIEENDFTIQVTAQKYLKTPMLTHKKVKEFINGYWYPLFREHLDSMAYYFIKIAYDEFQQESSTKHNAKYYNRMVKLRYDGDFELSVRNDFRNAFSHSVSNGTRRFTADVFKDIFDEVRFIDKSEIGYCVTCPNECNSRLINHAGNEIIDFITVYAARFMLSEHMKSDYITLQNKTEDEANAIVGQGLCIEMQDRPPIKPMDVIKPKIFIESND